MNRWLAFLSIAIFVPSFVIADLPLPKPKKTVKLPPCKLCTVLVESFKRGLDRTVRGSHDGGDVAWGEERLRKFQNSEVRLVEIQERLCFDVPHGEDQCHELADKHEPKLYSWLTEHQDTHPDLHAWFCVSETAVCCPPNHFGPNCDLCADCHGNGACKGNGTRKGNGKCACDDGYDGDDCMRCSIQYYESFRDEEKLLCSPCHIACKEDAGCTGSGPKACRVCANGWLMEPESGGCIDIDECATGHHTCDKNQFCVNSEGSFKCLDCDRSCNGCSGDGPDLCDECGDGFELRDGLCKDMTNERRQNYVTYTRYLTYFGLCIATCVIFQSSTWIASLIGLVVAVYISISEYWLRMRAPPTDGVQPLENFLKD